MDFPTQLVLVRFVKFASVLAYAGGVGMGVSGTDVPARKRAVHLFASPALVVIWLSGYVLTLYQRLPLSEAWIVGGFVSSLASQLILTRAARQPRVTPQTRNALLFTLGTTLLFMVVRPTWWSLLP
jgi:hypothetical protein